MSLEVGGVYKSKRFNTFVRIYSIEGHKAFSNGFPSPTVSQALKSKKEQSLDWYHVETGVWYDSNNNCGTGRNDLELSNLSPLKDTFQKEKVKQSNSIWEL